MNREKDRISRDAFNRSYSPAAYAVGQFDFARQCMSDWDSGKLVSCGYCAGYGYVANESEADVVDCPECHGDGYRRA